MAFNDTQPYISKVTLPSGNTYNIKDAAAREAIAALEGGSYFLGVTTTPLTDQATTNPVTVDGQSVTVTNGNIVVYGNAEFIWNGSKWIEFGDLSNLGQLAYKDSVSLNKGTGDNVLGEATTFTNASSAVTFSGGTTDKVLGSDATFSTTVTPSTTYIKATASGTAVGANGTAAAITGFGEHTTDTFVKSVSVTQGNKLVTTTVPNVTGNTNVSIPNVTGNTTVTANKSTWAFAMGSGTNAETLIISGGNGNDVTATNTTLGTALSASKVTLGTAITVATGSATSSGTGAALVTGVTVGDSATAITALGTPTTSNCLTGVKVTTQPTIALATDSTSGTGKVSVATGITSATTTTNNKDEVTAVTGIGTGTAAAQKITVGSNDRIKIAKYADLDVSVYSGGFNTEPVTED